MADEATIEDEVRFLGALAQAVEPFGEGVRAAQVARAIRDVCNHVVHLPPDVVERGTAWAVDRAEAIEKRVLAERKKKEAAELTHAIPGENTPHGEGATAEAEL